MDGLYIHIPFCASRCIYCDFFSTTRKESINRYIDALQLELSLKEEKGIFKWNEPLTTIYIGGGTPSILNSVHLSKLATSIYHSFDVVPHPEFTMECNPEDITFEYLHSLRSIPINRLSFGIQSFNEKYLRFSQRRHTSAKSLEAIHLSKEAGYQNISIDLMFGFPGETLEEWTNDIDMALSLNIPHISAYSLTYEHGTRLTQLLEKGKIHQIDEELSLSMYQTLIEKLNTAGYEQYEISNFAKPGFRSKHNSSYWSNKAYLGLGAGAHSYNGHGRSWNVSDIDIYMKDIEDRKIPETYESLSIVDKYNEYVMTRLRTKEGVQLHEIEQLFGHEMLQYFQRQAKLDILDGRLVFANNTVRLGRNGLFTSNDVISNLFVLSDNM